MVGLMNTGENRLVEKYTLPKFRHADKETNTMHCWVELRKNELWKLSHRCIVGDTNKRPSLPIGPVALTRTFQKDLMVVDLG